jgi:hypothetical protein
MKRFTWLQASQRSVARDPDGSVEINRLKRLWPQNP